MPASDPASRRTAKPQDCVCPGTGARPLPQDHRDSCPARARLLAEDDGAAWLLDRVGAARVLEAARQVYRVMSMGAIPFADFRDFDDVQLPVALELVGGDTVLIDPAGGMPFAAVVPWEKYCDVFVRAPAPRGQPIAPGNALGTVPDGPPRRGKTGRKPALDAEGQELLRRLATEAPGLSAAGLAEQLCRATGKPIGRDVVARWLKRLGIPASPRAPAGPGTTARAFVGRKLTAAERELLVSLFTDFPADTNARVAERFREATGRPIGDSNLAGYREAAERARAARHVYPIVRADPVPEKSRADG